MTYEEFLKGLYFTPSKEVGKKLYGLTIAYGKKEITLKHLRKEGEKILREAKSSNNLYPI